MSTVPTAVPSGPTPPRQRLLWIDALRGFALLGILLMNVELFNRAYASFSIGLDPAATGINRVADLLIYLLVRTKFWILFSLLFGMGFALMLERAQAAGRSFVRTYLRRTLLLLLFGAIHGILIWEGDILTGYAVTALFLLLALLGRLRDGVLAALALVLLAALFRNAALLSYLGLLLMAGLSGLYIRGDLRFRRFGREWLLTPCLLAALGLLIPLVTTIASFVRGETSDLSLFVFVVVLGLEFLLLAWMAGRRREPAQRRPLQIGIAWFSIFVLAAALAGAVTLNSAAPSTAQERQRSEQQLQERQEDSARQVRVLTTGSYAEVVAYRAESWIEEISRVGWTINYFAVFLIGLWLVRSGIAMEPERHLPALRRLCGLGLALGLLVTVGSASVLPLTHVSGGNDDAFTLQLYLHQLGALPLALGYLALLLLAWQTAVGRACLSWLAPVGRMALTNYLLQSVVCSLVFYGYGLGHWGIPRAQQAVFCFALFAVQIVLSAAWLRYFRFGPMEWVWRRLTYGRSRLQGGQAGGTGSPVAANG